jgi:hypothetical protein
MEMVSVLKALWRVKYCCTTSGGGGIFNRARVMCAENGRSSASRPSATTDLSTFCWRSFNASGAFTPTHRTRGLPLGGNCPTPLSFSSNVEEWMPASPAFIASHCRSSTSPMNRSVRCIWSRPIHFASDRPAHNLAIWLFMVSGKSSATNNRGIMISLIGRPAKISTHRTYSNWQRIIHVCCNHMASGIGASRSMCRQEQGEYHWER